MPAADVLLRVQRQRAGGGMSENKESTLRLL
jgi:hypothetical protein